MRDLDTHELRLVESIIDACGIDSMLMALSEICGQKAEHIAVNWQDTPLAMNWAKLEGAIGVLVPAARGL